MWDWISCHLCGRHEYCVCPEPGTVFLRCIHCGRRSNGWSLGAAGTASAARVQAGGSQGGPLRRMFGSRAHA
jgi:hypothetical protein